MRLITSLSLYMSNTMSTTVTVSPKYQIVIPQEAREAMQIKPGQRVMFMEWRGSFVLVPVPEPDEAFGMFKGHDVRIEREKYSNATHSATNRKRRS